MTTFLTLTGAGAVLAAVLWLRQYLVVQRLTHERMLAPYYDAAGPLLPCEQDMGWLLWWLFRAGYRSPLALETFLLASGCCLALGALVVFSFYRSGTLRKMLRGLEEIPGGVGDIFLPFAYALPW